MVRPFRWLLWLWLLLVAVPSLRAQSAPAVVCRICNDHGTVPCTKHGRWLEAESAAKGVQFCSGVAECKVCAGALATDCKACRNGPAETELEKRVQLVREWRAKRRVDIDQVVDHGNLFHLATTHVDLVFGIRPTTVGKEKLETHPLMHLYAERIEGLRSLFLSTFELQEADQPTRLQIYMFRNAQDQGVIGPRVTGIGNTMSTGTKLMGIDCVYSMWQDLRSFPDDEALWRGVIHNTTHLLLCNVPPAGVLYNKKQGWIDEGVAHWFEDKLTGKCTNFCFEEVLMMPGASFKGGRWRTPVRRLVDEGKARSFADLSTRNTDQLDFQDHAVAFAYVDFLLATKGGARFRDLVRLVKQDKPTHEALQAVYGWNPLTIEAPFVQWVKENYSPVESR